MQASEAQCFPGQMHTLRLDRASAIIALDGPLRLRYRDESLTWLLDAAPCIDITLRDGEQHILPFTTFVNMLTEGEQTVTAALAPAPDTLARLAALLRRARNVAMFFRRPSWVRVRE
ncbi:hypothetical protein LJR230_004468 [Trinickia sp. LjRoot230]|uniref:hypothetical protein n=1 Tax=Trinickia sp. LjRoot230 TaxID=3342288 RepID=UPI003ECF3AD2